jgi:hypothetical protein
MFSPTEEEKSFNLTFGCLDIRTVRREILRKRAFKRCGAKENRRLRLGKGGFEVSPLGFSLTEEEKSFN